MRPSAPRWSLGAFRLLVEEAFHQAADDRGHGEAVSGTPVAQLGVTLGGESDCGQLSAFPDRERRYADRQNAVVQLTDVRPGASPARRWPACWLSSTVGAAGLWLLLVGATINACAAVFSEIAHSVALRHVVAPANAILLAAQVRRTPSHLQGRVMAACYLSADRAMRTEV